jgi:hypothetical protein
MVPAMKRTKPFSLLPRRRTRFEEGHTAARVMMSAGRVALSSLTVLGLIGLGRLFRRPAPTNSGEDKRLELAYDAVVKRLAQQDATLGDLRTRATALLSTAALVTSFSATLGLINTDPNKGSLLPKWVAFVLLGLLVIIAVSAVFIHWPVPGWSFGPSGSKIMERTELGQDVDAVRRYVTNELIAARERNENKITRRARAYQWGVLALVVEVIVLVVGLMLPSKW